MQWTISRKRPEQRRRGLQLAPMVDVVFQLLIFFLVASEVRPTEAEFRTNLPWGNPPRDATVPKLEEYRVFLRNADDEGNAVEVSLNGRPLFGNPFETLQERLAGVADKDNMILIIDGEPGVKVGFVMKAIDSAVSAGVSRIAFARP